MRLSLANVDRAAFVTIAVLGCAILWRMSAAIHAQPVEPAGSAITFDFTSRLGTHHVLMQLGTIEGRDAAIQRHIGDVLALKSAVERIP